MFMAYSVIDKTFITTQKFCLILVFMSVIFMVPLIVWRGMRGHWPLSCTPMCLHGASGIRMTYGHFGFMPLTSPTSVTRWAGWVRGATRATVMGMPPMVMPMVIGLSPITIMGLTPVSIPILCFRGWVWVRYFISTRMGWPISAICGWRIIWVVIFIHLLLRSW